MKFDDLRLLPGARIKLTVAGDERAQSVNAKYVGSHTPRSLVAAVPASAIGTTLRQGTKLVVSLVTPTGIVNFASAIEASGVAPFSHVFLAYPQTVSIRHVRSALRVNVDMPAQAANLDAIDHLEMRPARILDMSVSGLKLGADHELGQPGDELAIHMLLTFDNIEREATVTGKIRTVTETQDIKGAPPFICGVEFASLEEDKRVLLHAFVLNMVQRHGAQT